MTNRVLCINGYSCFDIVHFEIGKFYDVEVNTNDRGLIAHHVYYQPRCCVVFPLYFSKNFYYYFKELKLGR